MVPLGWHPSESPTKISVICDTKGIPIDFKCYAGNDNDGKILNNHLSNCNLVQYHHSIKHNKYFLAQRVTSAYEVVD